MDNVNAALLPCPNPWCESHARPERNYAPFLGKGRAAPEFAVSCPVCPMRGPWGDDKSAAITAWNTRATTTDLQARLDASEARAEKYRAAMLRLRYANSLREWEDACKDVKAALATAPNAEGQGSEE